MIVREHPALFLGELREDLERIHAEDEKGNKLLIKQTGDNSGQTICGETLIPYPNNVEFEIVEK